MQASFLSFLGDSLKCYFVDFSGAISALGAIVVCVKTMSEVTSRIAGDLADGLVKGLKAAVEFFVYPLI